MSEDSTVVSRAARLRTAFTVLGSAYLAYHGLAAGWLVFEFFVNTRPGYWRESGVLAELALTICFGPAHRRNHRVLEIKGSHGAPSAGFLASECSAFRLLTVGP